ncbi:MAG: polysaccharide ABC transporter ATP-binding protein [Chitinophagaceae bacterium]
MSDAIIKATGLGKKYIISHETSERYTSLRDVISRKANRLVKKEKQLPAREEFWALKDVSFEIKPGEAVGIIGRNGAGKSTLLKILSRITEPTTGRIEINGRISSLLEVGTGFHPELTGRENIFLNGAILGMNRSEIRRKFDEIVDFSGVEKFLDTPVKRYSSGMYIRLAFAIAAHLEPEMLVIDEVLAVGDAEFQKKCLGKMEEVSHKEGRTVLFVSHDLGSISQLCSSAMLLNEGKVMHYGKTETVIREYLGTHKNRLGYKATGTGKNNFIKEFVLNNTRREESYSFSHDEQINAKFKVVIRDWQQGICLAYAIQNRYNKRVCLDYVEIKKNDLEEGGEINISAGLPKEFLTPGTYSFDVSVIIPNIEMFDALFSACPFEIIDNNSRITRFANHDYGDVFIHTTHSNDQ